MNNRNVNVRDIYFQHRTLVKIHGKPTYESLKILLNQIKANASSVPTTIGGGNHGHLGLVLSDLRYATLSNTPFATPHNPGNFAPPQPAGTGPQIDAARTIWQDQHHVFNICVSTQQALIAQVVEAIDPQYLQALLNTTTGRHTDSIGALILHLFTTYGKITPQQVKMKELETVNMHFDLSQPVDVVFNSIDNLADLSDHAGYPMTDMQLVNLGYMVFSRQAILLQDLRTWNHRPVAERTYTHMKTHMRNAQDDLSSLPISAGQMYHQQPPPPFQANVAEMADMVAQQLLQHPSHLDRAYSMQHGYPQPPPGYSGPPIEPPAPPPPATPAPPPAPAPIPDTTAIDLANSLQRRNDELLSQQQAMETMQNMFINMFCNNGGGGRNGRGRGNSGRGRGGRNDRSLHTAKYCWTHGACAHDGTQCNYPATGHKAQATLANKLGGSTRNCT